ncbi:MAG: hypothetical protein Q8P40_08550 [Nitrospirota bacterium]|nr:hypothetical protein [Nitrospirota bacterium]
MSRSGNERMTVRLSASDLRGLGKIKASGDFEDMSAAVRWCIHFSVALLRAIPAAITNSFVETEIVEEKKDDSLENTSQEVPKPCDCGNCETGKCGKENEKATV